MSDMIKALTEVLSLGICPTPGDNQLNADRVVLDHYAVSAPHSGSEGVHIDSVSGDHDHRAADSCGANHERLSAVKAVYDPADLVHVNQNIAPANGR